MTTYFIPRREAAAMLSVSPKTMANWACGNFGPRAYNPSGGRVLYDHAEVVAWIKGQQPTPILTPVVTPVKRARGRPRKHPRAA